MCLRNRARPHDSRDLQDAPKRGWVFNVNSIAYRQKIEGSNNFDVYRADYRHFWSHGEGHDRLKVRARSGAVPPNAL